MILSCFRCGGDLTAGAQFQDKTYGDGKRVHNECAKSGNGPVQYRCTICKTERSAKGLK